MSQVKFRTTYQDKNIEVMGGYDAPLNYYHLTIFDLDAMDEEVIWSNLEHFDFDDLRTTEPLKKVLADMNIQVPNGFWEIVERNEGNKFYHL